MNSQEVMKSDVECVRADDPVTHIAQRMRDRNIGFVPVCGEDGKVVGTITDRDLVLRVVAEQRDPNATLAKDVMSHGVVTSTPDQDLKDLELSMSKHKVSRIVVVDSEQRPIGIVSLSDVAKVETGRTASAVLRSVSQREARG